MPGVQLELLRGVTVRRPDTAVCRKPRAGTPGLALSSCHYRNTDDRETSATCGERHEHDPHHPVRHRRPCGHGRCPRRLARRSPSRLDHLDRSQGRRWPRTYRSAPAGGIGAALPDVDESMVGNDAEGRCGVPATQRLRHEAGRGSARHAKERRRLPGQHVEGGGTQWRQALARPRPCAVLDRHAHRPGPGRRSRSRHLPGQGSVQQGEDQRSGQDKAEDFARKINRQRQTLPACRA